MSRQHATPLLLRAGSPTAEVLTPLSLGGGPDQVSEATIRDLIHDHPRLLPVREIDAAYADPVAVCTELPIINQAVDNLLVTATGMPVAVECKLWRNAESRREVVGQILQYAKSLSR